MCSGLIAGLAQRLLDRVDDRPHLPDVLARADHEVVGERPLRPQVEQGDVLGLLRRTPPPGRAADLRGRRPGGARTNACCRLCSCKWTAAVRRPVEVVTRDVPLDGRRHQAVDGPPLPRAAGARRWTTRPASSASRKITDGDAGIVARPARRRAGRRSLERSSGTARRPRARGRVPAARRRRSGQQSSSAG